MLNIFQSFGNWASGQLGLQDQWDKSGFQDAWGGGNWRDRVKTTLPSATQLPTALKNPSLPNDRNMLSVAGDIAVNKIWMPAFATEGSGFHRLATNLSETGKSIGQTVQYPQQTWDQWGAEWTRMTQGGPSDSDDDNYVPPSPSGNEGITGSETGGSSNTAEEERARLDAIRRMLAGRYGRAETNLTGGSGYGSGESRGLGGY